MADVRSLLRQQRAARRVVHPHAAYSDGGKLLCTICHELIKAESLWDGHIQSAAHLQRSQKILASKPVANDQDISSHKRKYADEDTDDMSIEDGQEEAGRKKRSRQGVHDAESGQDGQGDKYEDKSAETNKMTPTRTQNLTPPLLRRTSGTPVQGVEMQIPSRPATPVAVRTESKAPNGSVATAGRSPLWSQKEPTAVAGFVSTADEAIEIPASTAEAARPPQPTKDIALPETAEDKETRAIDEDEWAAFEADLVHGHSNGTSARAGKVVSADAVISAPAMTAEEVAVKSEEEARERRRVTADVELENEKEEATRALETEFEDMEELEARVRRLKERREALRQRRGSLTSTGPDGAGMGKGGVVPASAGKENADAPSGKGQSEEDEDEDDEEDGDDWAGFRFRG